MKRQIQVLLAVVMGIIILFASCSKDDDPTPAPSPEPVKPVTYTVMLYGCGGGNLDDCLDFNLNQLEGYGKAERVNFAGLIKYSKPYQKNDDTKGTFNITMTSEGLKREQVHDANYRLDNPAHLTDFINETKAKMPADKYILIFWNHGQEFGVSDKAVQDAYPEGTRAVAFDDNTDTSMSTFEIEKGIKDAGIKLDLIYLDVCNMGMVEVNYQLKDCTRYLMAASSPTPGIGGNYAELFNALQTNDSIQGAIKEYVPKCVRNWKNSGTETADLECYDLSYMDEFAGYFKNVVDVLKGYEQKAKTERKDNLQKYGFPLLPDWYGNIIGNTEDGYIFSGKNISVDICSIVIRIAAERLDGKLSSMATFMRNTLSKMTVAQASIGYPAWMDIVSMGILWPSDAFAYLRDMPQMSYCLDNAAFYKATGWGDFLKNVEILDAKALKFTSSVYYVEKTNDVPSQKYQWLSMISYDEESVPEDKREEVADAVQTLMILFAMVQSGDSHELRYGTLVHREAQKLTDNLRVSQMLKDYGLKQYSIVTRLVDEVDDADTDKDKFPTEFTTVVDVE